MMLREQHRDEFYIKRDIGGDCPMLRQIVFLLMIVGVFAMPALASAEAKMDISTRAEIEVRKVDSKGKETVVRVVASEATVVPGYTVLFATEYRNIGDRAVDDGAVINNPVPEQMTYIEKSAYGDDTKIQFSVDGGKSYDEPTKLFVKGNDGKMRKALPEDYTHIRWVLQKSLLPGSAGSVGYKAKVK